MQASHCVIALGQRILGDEKLFCMGNILGEALEGGYLSLIDSISRLDFNYDACTLGLIDDEINFCPIFRGEIGKFPILLEYFCKTMDLVDQKLLKDFSICGRQIQEAPFLASRSRIPLVATRG